MDDGIIEKLRKPSSFFGVRHIQYVLLFSASIVAYGVRIAFNVGVIAMISETSPNSTIPTYPEWASRKNILLSSFFWGYVAPQIYAGYLAKKYGAKWFLGITTFVGSVFSLLIPYLGDVFGYRGVIVCRVIQGVGQSFLYPCVHTLLSHWTPIADRAKVGAFTYSGVPLGTLISMPITGLLSNDKNIGWPMSFYFFGVIGIIWSILWAFLGSDSPAEYKTISPMEREYIEYGSSCKNEEKVPVPWKSILTSLPFWAILITHCGENWGYWTLLTEIPSYLQKILDFNIASNSLLSALPYFVFWILTFVVGPIADWLIQRKITTRTTSRKIFTSISMFVPVVCLIALTFVERTERFTTMILLVISVGSASGIFCGFYINHIDLSPNHAGTLMGFTTMVSNVASLLAPLSVDVIVYTTGYQETDKQLWNIIFYLAVVLYFTTGLFYVYGASGERQPWDSPKTENYKMTEEDDSL